MNPVIPKSNRDLKWYVIRRKSLQILLFLLWIAAFVFGALAYNNAHQTYPPERQIIGWRLVFWILASILSGFFLFRLPRLFTDRTFEGNIEVSGLSHSYSSSADPGAGSSVNYDFRLNTYLVVRTEDGKKKRIRFEQKPGFYIYYHEGTHVCHLRGLPYPIRDPERMILPEVKPGSEEEKAFRHILNGYVCAACGTVNSSLDEPCSICGHSLIDPKELWGEH